MDSHFSQRKTPSRAVLRPRRRLSIWCAVDCARGGLGVALPIPTISEPLRGLEYRPACGRCQGPGASPLVLADRPSNAWEGYNYKSFRARLLVVTHTAYSGGVLNPNGNRLGTGTRRRARESVTRAKKSLSLLVDRGGIEPPTPGFSEPRPDGG